MSESGPEINSQPVVQQPTAEVTPTTVPSSEKKGFLAGLFGGLGSFLKPKEISEPPRPTEPPAQPEQLRDPVMKLPQDSYKPA